MIVSQYIEPHKSYSQPSRSMSATHGDLYRHGRSVYLHAARRCASVLKIRHFRHIFALLYLCTNFPFRDVRLQTLIKVCHANASVYNRKEQQ